MSGLARLASPLAQPLRWRLAFAAAVVCFGAACVDGYPQEDEPLRNPFDMTPAQRLAEMNSLGKDAHPERRWQYEMRPGCVLRVDVDGPAGPRPSVDVPLLGAVVQLSRDKVDATFNIDVHSGPHGARSETSVLESLRWADANVMLLLVRVLQLGCANAVAGTEQGGG